MSSLTHPFTPSLLNLLLLLLLLWSHWGFCFPTLSCEGLLCTPWDVFQLPLSCWAWRRPHRPEILLAPAVTPFSDASTQHWRQEQSSPDISLCVTDSSVSFQSSLSLPVSPFCWKKKKKRKKKLLKLPNKLVSPLQKLHGDLYMQVWFPDSPKSSLKTHKWAKSSWLWPICCMSTAGISSPGPLTAVTG